MLKLGYSLGGINPDYSVKERIKILSSVETYAVEISYIIVGNLQNNLDDEDVKNIKQFDYISLHAPALISKNQETGEKVWIRYTNNKDSDMIIDQLLEIAHTIGANTILFHPDLVDNFQRLDKKLGSLLSFENMDINKPFGSSIEDLKKVFKEAPHAKWVCDLNHIYTVDSTMKLAEEFHDAFKDKLCHYHLSAYGGFHECFCVSGENIILKGIKDNSIPIIHEGGALKGGKESLIKENKYILKKYQL